MNVVQVEHYLRKIHQLSDSADANLDAVALVQDLKSLVFIDMDDRDAGIPFLSSSFCFRSNFISSFV
jgi:hypothetical protein